MSVKFGGSTVKMAGAQRSAAQARPKDSSWALAAGHFGAGVSIGTWIVLPNFETVVVDAWASADMRQRGWWT